MTPRHQVYKILNIRNNNSYIGVTGNLTNRIKGHKCPPNKKIKEYLNG